MLNGMHLGAAIGDGGRQPRVGHGLGRNNNIYRLRQINPPENDAAIRRRRPQGQLHPLATVQADADRFGQGFEGALGELASILI